MYQFSIQESAPIGTAVGRVKAEVITDSDTQEAIIVVQKVRLPRK